MAEGPRFASDHCQSAAVLCTVSGGGFAGGLDGRLLLRSCIQGTLPSFCVEGGRAHFFPHRR